MRRREDPIQHNGRNPPDSRGWLEDPLWGQAGLPSGELWSPLPSHLQAELWEGLQAGIAAAQGICQHNNHNMVCSYDTSCNCDMTFVPGGVSLSLGAVLNLSLSFPQSYFLSQAQSLCSSERSAIPDSLRWLCHPLGQKFFVERSWTVKSAAKESLYCTQRNPGESRFCPECLPS